MPWNQNQSNHSFQSAEDTEKPINQSKLIVNKRSWREGRENVCGRIVIGLGFISDWTKKVALVFKPIVYVVIQNQLLLDDQVNTYRLFHYQNKSFTVFEHHKYLRVFGKRSTSEGIVKNHYFSRHHSESNHTDYYH